jgi:hypothetical protein
MLTYHSLHQRKAVLKHTQSKRWRGAFGLRPVYRRFIWKAVEPG